jgi:hypothetical protein
MLDQFFGCGDGAIGFSMIVIVGIDENDPNQIGRATYIGSTTSRDFDKFRR